MGNITRPPPSKRQTRPRESQRSHHAIPQLEITIRKYKKPKPLRALFDRDQLLRLSGWIADDEFEHALELPESGAAV